MARDTTPNAAPAQGTELEELLIDAEADDEQVQTQPVLLQRPWLLLLGLVLVALNLRPALSSMAPLLSQVSDSLGLSASQAGLLTTLPVLCLGLFAPLAPVLARRFGSERVVLGILLTLAAGIAVRSAFGATGLFVGSIMAGASIGVIGVLLPGIVKRDFPQHAGTLTGVYTMALCLGAAMAAGATVPLSQHLVFGWLPSILIGRGLTATQAGLVLSGSVIVQLASSLAAPWLATRGKDQRLAIVLVMLLALAGLFGCLYAPLEGLWGWAIVLGLGQGGTFALALTLIVLRSRDAHVAANLSSMAQGVGYTLASMGPFAVGLVHDLTGGWNAVGWIFAVLGVGAIGFGLKAGRNLHVQVVSERV